MSQPLSQGMNRKLKIQPEPRRSYQMSTNNAESQRVIPARDVVTLLLFLCALIAAPVGAGVAWGVGVGVFVLGVTALVLGILLGVI